MVVLLQDQSRPKVGQKSAPSRPQVGPKSARRPKVSPSRPQVGQKSGKSQAKVDVDGTIASFEIREMSFLELDSGTLTLLSCGSMSYAEKDGGTISTVNGNCNYGSNSY